MKSLHNEAADTRSQLMNPLTVLIMHCNLSWFFTKHINQDKAQGFRYDSLIKHMHSYWEPPKDELSGFRNLTRLYYLHTKQKCERRLKLHTHWCEVNTVGRQHTALWGLCIYKFWEGETCVKCGFDSGENHRFLEWALINQDPSVCLQASESGLHYPKTLTPTFFSHFLIIWC